MLGELEERREHLFRRQQEEAELAMRNLLNEEEEARKAMAAKNAQQPKKQGRWVSLPQAFAIGVVILLSLHFAATI